MKVDYESDCDTIQIVLEQVATKIARQSST